jgi:hypothetical protein
MEPFGGGAGESGVLGHEHAVRGITTSQSQGLTTKPNV